MTIDFTRLFDYTRWADRRLLAHLEHVGEVPPQALTLYAHVVNAERIWLLRIQGVDTNAMEIWPSLTLEECRTLTYETGTLYAAYLEDATDAELERFVQYRNQTGAEYRTRVFDILTHVSLHGAYHRGQIATRLREAGIEPVNTDFITFVREGG
jgi:uncharacterized damage-inducible protein DinB